jgi:hypothetical protein
VQVSEQHVGDVGRGVSGLGQAAGQLAADKRPQRLGSLPGVHQDHLAQPDYQVSADGELEGAVPVQQLRVPVPVRLGPAQAGYPDACGLLPQPHVRRILPPLTVSQRDYRP